MKEYLVGFTASSVTAGGTFDDLGFTRTQELLANWDYGNSVLTGPFDERILTAASLGTAYDIPGSLSDLVVDPIVIDPLLDTYPDWVSYVIEPDPLNFDVIVSDRTDPTPGSFLNPAFSKVTLHVPEPATVGGLLLLAGITCRRRHCPIHLATGHNRSTPPPVAQLFLPMPPASLCVAAKKLVARGLRIVSRIGVQNRLPDDS